MSLRSLLSVLLLLDTTNAQAAFAVKKIASGLDHTCAVSVDGGLKCWGANFAGQLGLGSEENVVGRDSGSMGKNLPRVNLGKDIKVTDVCLGNQFSCALTDAAKIKCWGRGESLGQGRGDTNSIGRRPTEMGDALLFTDLGANFQAKALSCGESHACAINQDGKAKCWGSNVNGQLGIERDATNIGVKAGEMGDQLPFVIESQKLLSISLGDQFSCALLADRSFKCWGKNSDGALGIETTDTHGKTKASMDSSLPPVKLESGPYKGIAVSGGFRSACATYEYNGKVKMKCWGNNSYGQLGIGSNTESFGAKADSMGANLPEVNSGFDNPSEFHVYGGMSCATTPNHLLKCWGYNNDGRLGQGGTVASGLDPKTMGKNLPFSNLGLPIKSLSFGPYTSHICAVLINSMAKCWGANGSGQLGTESSVGAGSAPDEMGDNLQYVRLD